MGTYRSPAVALMPDVTPKPLRSKGNAIINLMGAVGGVLYLLVAAALYSGKSAADEGHGRTMPPALCGEPKTKSRPLSGMGMAQPLCGGVCLRNSTFSRPGRPKSPRMLSPTADSNRSSSLSAFKLLLCVVVELKYFFCM